MTSHAFVQWVSDGTGRSGTEVVTVLGAAALTTAVIAVLRVTDAVNEARTHHAAAAHTTRATGQDLSSAPEATRATRATRR